MGLAFVKQWTCNGCGATASGDMPEGWFYFPELVDQPVCCNTCGPDVIRQYTAERSAAQVEEVITTKQAEAKAEADAKAAALATPADQTPPQTPADQTPPQ